MRKIFLLSLIMIVSISCSSLNKSVNKANFSASASTSLEADVEVGGKIKGTSKATLLLLGNLLMMIRACMSLDYVIKT